MAISPIQPPRPIVPPAVTPIALPSLQPARDGGLRVVVWFRPGVALPEDEILCTDGTVAALFGPDVAQRLLMTPATAWLRRLLPGPLAEALDATAGAPGDDVVASTPYSQIYLLRLTGEFGVAHVCDVIGATANVRLVYPEPTITENGVPTQYASNAVFKTEQAYLKAGQGINAEPAWAKGYTGVGVQAAVVDMDANFSGLPFTPRIVKPPAGTAAPASASSTVSTHARQTTGILGCPDNSSIGIGAAPEVSLAFSPVPAVGTAPLASIAAAISLVLTNGGLKPGDVVNLSIGINAALDVKQPYSSYAALMAQDGTAAWPHHLVTEKVGADTRPSAVVSALPLEFEPSLLKLVADLTAQGVTVVQAAGNGMAALCAPKGAVTTPAWIATNLGSDVGGPWLAGNMAPTLAAFRSGLAKKAPHRLDRADAASFADGGGIVVAAGWFSPKKNGMIDNLALNHGNRVDCYVNMPNAQTLGFFSTPGGPFIGGTSLCAPAIAGVVAIVQSVAKAQFKAPLRPAFVRALLSDPDLGTVTVSGSPVGVMPDLAKLMAFLEKPQGKPDDLLKGVQAQQQKSMAQAQVAAVPGAGGGYDPYARFVRGPTGGTWQPLPLASPSDLFMP